MSLISVLKAPVKVSLQGSFFQCSFEVSFQWLLVWGVLGFWFKARFDGFPLRAPFEGCFMKVPSKGIVRVLFEGSIKFSVLGFCMAQDHEECIGAVPTSGTIACTPERGSLNPNPTCRPQRPK